MSTLYFYATAHPFSNFHPSTFTEHGLTYRWAEQYLMARKARLFGDKTRLATILAAHTPAECKALGRKVSPHDNTTWGRERYGVGLDMIRLKFGQSDKLHTFLLETGDAELVEAAANNRIWGVGYNEQEAEAHRALWGENLLGKALMNVRAELRAHV